MFSSPEAAAFLQFGAFLTDVAVAAVAAWLLVRACTEIGRGILESLLAWCLAFVAMAAAAGVVLGETGGLGAAGFLAFHAGLLGALALGRHSRLAGDLSEASRIAREARLFLTSGGPEAFAAATLLLVLFLLAGIAALAEPSGADALSYHLPRIGQWLLDGHVHELASQDERMNFVATVPDLVMSWLICGTSVGFRPLVLAQAFGGIMTVGATVGLARQTGLGRGPALLAGALLLGMANVAVQFASAQTDLFTTGVFASAFYLWACALRRGTGSWLGGLGAGLALGAKGTLFYLAPGALIWVAAFSWNARLPWTKWGRTLLAAAIGVVLFALPGFARNWRIYGDALGPKEWVSKLHQGALSQRDYQRKLRWNLTSSLAQVFEPQSQPHGLREAGRAVVGALGRHVPARDAYTLDGLGRKAIYALRCRVGRLHRHSRRWRIYLSSAGSRWRATRDRRRGGGQDRAALCAGLRLAGQCDALRSRLAGVARGPDTFHLEGLHSVSDGEPRLLWEGPALPLNDVPPAAFSHPRQDAVKAGNRE